MGDAWEVVRNFSKSLYLGPNYGINSVSGKKLQDTEIICPGRGVHLHAPALCMGHLVTKPHVNLTNVHVHTHIIV